MASDRQTRTQIAAAARAAIRDGHGLYSDLSDQRYGRQCSLAVLRYRARRPRAHGWAWGPLHTVALGRGAGESAPRAARQQLLDGIDPLEAQQAGAEGRNAQLAAAEALTFARAAAQLSTHDAHEERWRNAQTCGAVSCATLTQYALPPISARCRRRPRSTRRAGAHVCWNSRVAAARGYPAGSALVRPAGDRQPRCAAASRPCWIGPPRAAIARATTPHRWKAASRGGDGPGPAAPSRKVEHRRRRCHYAQVGQFLADLRDSAKARPHVPWSSRS